MVSIVSPWKIIMESETRGSIFRFHVGLIYIHIYTLPKTNMDPENGTLTVFLYKHLQANYVQSPC